MKGVAPERMAARGKAFAPVSQLMSRRNVRSVSLGNGLYPNEERAEQFGISREQLAELMYGGVDVDYAQLKSTGDQVRKTLAAGKELRITSADGTNLRVGIAGRPVQVSDGVISAEDRKKGGPAVSVWLPAGEVFLTPVAGSANGVVVADHVFYQGDRVDGLRLELKGGKVVGMTAKSGLEPLEQYYKVAGAGKDVFGVVDIGINPAIEVPEGGAVNVWSRAGAVTVVVGNNTWAGGDNRVNFSLSPEIKNATLEVDGTAIVKDGKLVAAPPWRVARRPGGSSGHRCRPGVHRVHHERVLERQLLQPVVLPRQPPVPSREVGPQVGGFDPRFVARSFATHLAGSQYITCESLNEVVTSRAGYSFAATFPQSEARHVYAHGVLGAWPDRKAKFQRDARVPRGRHLIPA